MTNIRPHSKITWVSVIRLITLTTSSCDMRGLPSALRPLDKSPDTLYLKPTVTSFTFIIFYIAQGFRPAG